MNPPKSPRRRVARILVLALILLFGVWLVTMVILAGSLWKQFQRLQQVGANASHVSLTTLASGVHAARQEFTILHAGLSPLLWLTSLFGGDAGAVKPLADAGLDLLAAGDESLNALTPSLGSTQLASLSAGQLPQILNTLAEADPKMANARTHVDRAATDLQRIHGPLSSRMEHWSSMMSQAVEWAQNGFMAARVAPGLLGQNGPRSYLLLLENTDELRATGGFISAVGLVKVDQGKLVSLSVQDSYTLEDFTQWHPDPPRPLLEYMAAEQWVVRDSNWSPDFPTSAQDAIRLYTISHPGQVDGVIGLTAEGVKMLIASLSPLQVKGLPEPITPGNFDKIMAAAWNPPPNTSSVQELRVWMKTRKQALGLVMNAAMEKVLHGQTDWPGLAQQTLKAFDQRQLMVYSPAEADRLSQIQWDGSLRSSPGDYLMVVDSNVGFNKANSLISENVKYQVALQPDGTARAALQIDYTHKGRHANIVCKQFTKYDANITYSQLQQRCYFDYLRVLLPLGSTLLQSVPQPASSDELLPGVPTAGLAGMTQDESLDRAVLDQFFVVEYGRQLQAHFEIGLPQVVKDADGRKLYSLLIQKQPGTESVPLDVKVILPAGARFVSANLHPAAVSGASIEFKLILDTDQQIQVTYNPAP